MQVATAHQGAEVGGAAARRDLAARLCHQDGRAAGSQIGHAAGQRAKIRVGDNDVVVTHVGGTRVCHREDRIGSIGHDVAVEIPLVGHGRCIADDDAEVHRRAATEDLAGRLLGNEV